MLKKIIEKVLYEYPIVSKENFKGHSFASYLRSDVPASLNNYLNLPNVYSIQASPGNGAWANIPWIAIFNKVITESVRSGFFVVYLFSADFSGVYLSLIQGTDSQKAIYGLGRSREVLRNQAKVFRSLIGQKIGIHMSDKIDLKLEAIPKETTARRLGKAYEAGNILAIYYSIDNIPLDEQLVKDLLEMLGLYEYLIENQPGESQDNDADSEEIWLEDLTKYRIHRRVERNQALSKKAKEIHGYICKACGFDFEAFYGGIGRKYIEAHHNIPVSSLEKTKIQLDPAKDFTVLCSNCHRMIHRIKPTPSLEEFKVIIEESISAKRENGTH